MQKATYREDKSPADEPKAVYGGGRSVASGGWVPPGQTHLNFLRAKITTAVHSGRFGNPSHRPSEPILAVATLPCHIRFNRS